MKLSDIKQNAIKDSGIIENPEEMKTLSREDIRKILPDKISDEDTPQKLINDELSGIDSLIANEQSLAEEKTTEIYTENKEEFDDAIFDAPVGDIDAGLLSPEQAEEELKKAMDNAKKSIEEDPNIKAGIDAVNNVAKSITTPENMEMEDFLKDLEEDEEFDKDEEEFDVEESDDEEDEEERESQKKMLKEMKDQVEKLIKPFDTVVDLKGFTISTKPKSTADVLGSFTNGPTATWVLLDSRTPFTCTALGAVEIENLDPEKTNRQNGRIDALKNMYGTLFRHYVSADKPNTIEEWLKTISFTDQDNLIFGYYKATFGSANFITYACDKCKEVKIENVPIDDCVKYNNDETKKEVEKILKFGDPTFKSEIKGKLIQISDTLAVSVKSPSIYNIIFEFGVLDAEFTNKYADVLGTVGYIEQFYEIDVYNRQLVPIKVKEDPKNLTKSVKRKIRANVEILKGLTPDQYNILLSEIATMSQNSSRISYCIPEYKCKKCDNVIDAVEMSAQAMLFTRHQLALIKNLSIE